MREKILGAAAAFVSHLLKNIGRPISLSTLGAFNEFLQVVLDAFKEGGVE